MPCGFCFSCVFCWALYGEAKMILYICSVVKYSRHIPTFFSAWYSNLVSCMYILEFVLDQSKLPTTISSKYFQLLIFERISCIHRTVSYSIRTEKEFNGWNFLQNLQKNYVGEASRNLSTKNIDTLTWAQEKRYVVQLNSAPINVSKTQD